MESEKAYRRGVQNEVPFKMLQKATPARNTPRKRGRKTISDKELRERHEAVAAALANGKSKGDIKRELGTKWDVCPRTMENYIARAREILSEWHDFAQGSDSRIELIAEVTKTFRDTMHAEKSSFRDKTDAAAKLAKLFGLDAPMRMAQTKTRRHGRRRLGGPGAHERRRAAVLPENTTFARIDQHHESL